MQLRRKISTALAARGGALSACAARPLGKAPLAAWHLGCNRRASPGPRAAPQNSGCSNADSWLADPAPCLTERQQTTAPGRRKQRTELDWDARCKIQTRALSGVGGVRLTRKASETKARSRGKQRTELDRDARCKIQTRALGGVGGARLMRNASETRARGRGKQRTVLDRDAWCKTQNHDESY